MNLKDIGTGFHILAKPIGPRCNLDCDYCFYTEKSELFSKADSFKMSELVLETYIKNYIQSQSIPEIQFVWQGGEPTLLGIDYFKKIIQYQCKYADGKTIINTIQTNGSLINEEWCRFIKTNNILMGISIDGPEVINDFYRKDLKGQPTAKRVINAIELFNKHEIQYNALVCVTHASAKKGLEIYNFLKEIGVKYIQFTPIVERTANTSETQIGLKHAAPAHEKQAQRHHQTTSFSVLKGEYGDFLIEIFDQWVRNDVGTIFIMNFEWALECWLGLPSTVCIFSKTCGKALAIEHNGDLFACDHYVYPEYKLGNILKDTLRDIIDAPKQVAFGTEKYDGLPNQCQKCEVKFACNGECPRHRFENTSDGEYGLNYLCTDYKKYFHHIHPYMKVMVKLITNNLPVSKVMEVIKGPIVVVKH